MMETGIPNTGKKSLNLDNQSMDSALENCFHLPDGKLTQLLCIVQISERLPLRRGLYRIISIFTSSRLIQKNEDLKKDG